MAAEFFLLLLSDPPVPEALRFFWRCGAGNGESTSAGAEVSHWASCSVHPGIAACKRARNRPSAYLVLKTVNARMRSDSREPESKPKPCQSPLLRMACASANGRESMVSAFKWSTISWRVGSLLQGIPGRLLPFTSTRSCSNENGRYSRCSGESMQ